MTDFTLSPRFLDLILLLTVAEFVLLGINNSRTRRGLQWLDLALALAPGLLLMLAFRLSDPAALSTPVLASLSLAGLLHGADFYRRHRAPGLAGV